MNDKLKALQQELAQVKQKLAVKEKELENKEKVFKAVIDNSIVGYWEWDIKNDKEYLSPSFKMMFGYEAHEMTEEPTTWRNIIHPEDLEKAQEIFQRCKQSDVDEYYATEVRYYHKDGSLVDIFCSGRVTERDANNIPTKMVGSHINISPLKKVQRKLMETTKLLSRQNKRLHDFAYITTHNMRSPIGNLVSLHGLYELCETPQEKEDMVAKLNDISHELLRNVNELSDTLKKDHKDDENIFFSKVFDNVKKQLSNTIAQKEATLSCSFDNQPTIRYPKIYLESILLNLISNALKYSSPKRTVRISVTTKRNNNKTQLCVSDNGLGIDMEKHGHKIFGLYNTFHKNADAKGIGLFITKTQIESLGGNITVDSIPDQGTTFTVTF